MSRIANVQLNATQGKGGDTLRLPAFIIVELIGEDDQPIPSEDYAIALPGGKVVTGTLDANGRVKLEGIPAGTCQVSFPKLDKEAWVPVETRSEESAAA